MIRRLSGLALMATPVILAVACGSSGSDKPSPSATPSMTAQEMILLSSQRLQEQTTYQGSFRTETVLASGLRSDTGTTSFRYQAPRTYVFSPSPDGTRMTSELLIDPPDAYSRKSGQWSPENAETAAEMMWAGGLLGRDPMSYSLVAQYVRDPDLLPDESIDGTPYLRVHAALDPEWLLAILTDATRARLEAKGPGSLADFAAGTSVFVDIWLDKDTLLPRRWVSKVDVGQKGSVITSRPVDYWGFGDPVDIPELE